jgi:hypothetical protein
MILVFFLLAGVAAAASELPDRVVLVGVPYISWSEMQARDYPGKEAVNPSFAASSEMVRQYWALHEEADVAKARWEKDRRNAAGFEVIQELLANGVPVQVNLALTPSAHPLYVVWYIHLLVTGERSLRDAIDREKARTTGVLGTFISLDLIRQTQASMERNRVEGRLFWDSFLRADRVVIGYDIGRRIVILHDPSFGPALEMPMDQFTAMWEATDREYFISRPKTPGRKLPPAANPAGYPGRSAAQRAAQAYVFAYGEAASGRLPAAKTAYTGLADRPDTPRNLRHLALLELAHLELREGHATAATELAEKAIGLERDDPVAWSILASALERSPASGDARKAREAHARAADLCKNKKGMRELSERLSAGVLLLIPCN